ncbi:hypothetical protein DSO57_1017576 [Entomophthora muscae]|uniref:Uncharacterized protein n=2 Tax=Entomophthora muscae TaxID=34485 RepID=A0ACC2UDR8_9FUNG|nr:hypothetical protein DSO57_1017574 [Entomophthora muscae]KAJ9085054.1 hypothetical protein DSO57_1017576 [Entomophthora muscae]
MFLICLLALVQCVRTVELFGGGCLVENNKLTISGACTMRQDGTVEELEIGYQLVLNIETKLPENNEIDWKPVSSGYELPGEFLVFTYQNKPYPAYIVGGLAWRKLNNRDDGEQLSTDQPSVSYPEALKDGLDVGIFQDNKHTLFLDPENPHNLSTISIVEGGSFTFKPTYGSIPSYAKGFSAAHHRDSVYIVDSDHVYVFDLKTSTWNSHRVPGLVAARNGCLYLHDTTLIHAFGKVNNTLSSKTYFIDTVNWKLTNQLKPPKTDLTLLIILGISTLALLIPVAIYGFIRFRNRRNTLPPPQFYTEKIWVDHTISTCSLDYNLNSDPISSFDKTLVPTTSNTPLSPNNIFDY